MTTWTDDRYATLIRQADQLRQQDWRARHATTDPPPDLTDEETERLERLDAACWYLATRGNRQ